MKQEIVGLLVAMLCLAPAHTLGAEPEDADPQAFFISLLYRADVLATLSGGLDQGTTALGNLDAKLDVDLDRLMGWEGVTLGLHGIASQGGKPNGDYVGSSQGVDNIEVDTNTAKLFQAWIQKSWADDQASLLLGLYDLNSEFYVSHSTGIFLHPSPGIGSEFAQTGVNGPSIFPTSSVALRVRVRPTDETYVQAVVLDGVPGDPNNPRGTHVQFNDGDGTLRVVEMGYIPDPSKALGQDGLPPTDKYAIGAWGYTSRFEDLVDVDGLGNPVLRKGNEGFYVLAERTLYRKKQHPNSHVDGFIRYGHANGDLNQFTSYFQTGLVFTGMVPGRTDDQFAFSYTRAQTGDKWRLAAANAGQDPTKQESVWEATYRAPVTPWLVVQPNFQYVIHPGADAQVDDATVLGLRFEMSWDR